MIEEKILKKIREALVRPSPRKYADVDNAHEVLKFSDDLLLDFAKVLTSENCAFFYCPSVITLAEQFLLLCENNKWLKLSYYDIGSSRMLKYFEFPAVQAKPGKPLQYPVVQRCDAVLASGEIIFRNALHPVQFALGETNDLILMCDTANIFKQLQPALNFIGRLQPVVGGGYYLATSSAMRRPYAYNELQQPIAEKNIYFFLAENFDDVLNADIENL